MSTDRSPYRFLQDDAYEQRAKNAIQIARNVSKKFDAPALIASLFVLAMCVGPDQIDDAEQIVDDVASDCHRRAKEDLGAAPRGSVAAAQWQNAVADLHLAYLDVEAAKLQLSWLERLSSAEVQDDEEPEPEPEAPSAVTDKDDPPKRSRAKKPKNNAPSDEAAPE